ncbi:copper homeostasis protein CutC [Pareuzebyella sediminis]|uniref:copper homeostasis protein CutC n=1 Tax=Pareuzebyella sediminis TaxID=2607998 RepID=UPI0011EDC0C2|nr:copper homeostasis protein CutC [Pareuzebyella sediminis]
MLVEVCANSLQSALNAENAGASRIELCSELAVGGVTPSYGLLKSVKKKISIPVHVLIRPRSGDFTYSDADFQIMQQDIELCSALGFEGVVSGILKDDFTIDMERTKALIESAKGMKFTFHRAFDWIKNPIEGALQLEGMGVNYILTSGQQKSAALGIDLLNELHRMTSSCEIMPGGGVRMDNIHVFGEVGFTVVHLSGTKFVKTLSERPRVEMNSTSFLREDAIAFSDVEAIREIVNAVK